MPPVDVEDRGPGQDQPGEAAWRPEPVLKGQRNRRGRVGTVIAITAVAIAVAAIKPWGIGGPGASPSLTGAPPAVVAPQESTAAQPTPAPVIADRNAMTCLTHQVEQVLTLERWADREIKSWSQPDGPMVIISSSHVVGIGVCPGIGPAASAGAATASRDPIVWAGAVVTDVQVVKGSKVVDLAAPPQITVQTDYVGAGVLYGAPLQVGLASPGPSAEPLPSLLLPAWPAGRYKISYVFPGDPEHTTRTVVVQITTPLNDG